MSAVKTRTPYSSASSRASLDTGTSKASSTAYFLQPFSDITLARRMSRLCTGPMLMPFVLLLVLLVFFGGGGVEGREIYTQTHTSQAKPNNSHPQASIIANKLNHLNHHPPPLPLLIPDTGMSTSGVSRNVSSASRLPSVLACTHTPSPLLSTFVCLFWRVV